MCACKGVLEGLPNATHGEPICSAGYAPTVLSSPAHQLPEIKQEYEEWAEDYVGKMRLPRWMESHLAWAFLNGQQYERNKQ